MFGAPTPRGHVPWPWRCRAHRPICTWSRFRRSWWPCRCRPSDAPASFLRAQPHRLRPRPVLCSRNQPAARARAWDCEGGGPRAAPTKAPNASASFLCQTPPGPPGGLPPLVPVAAGTAGPEVLVPGSPPAVPAGIGEQTGWCCPRRPRPLRAHTQVWPEAAGPALTSRMKMDRPAEKPEPDGETRSPRESWTWASLAVPVLDAREAGHLCSQTDGPAATGPPHGHGRPGSQEPALVGTTGLLAGYTWGCRALGEPRRPPGSAWPRPFPGSWSRAPAGTGHCPG